MKGTLEMQMVHQFSESEVDHLELLTFSFPTYFKTFQCSSWNHFGATTQYRSDMLSEKNPINVA